MSSPCEEVLAHRAPAGVYGLGFVGAHAALGLARAYRILAYDPDPARRAALRAALAGEARGAPGPAGAGLTVVDTPAALAPCGVMLLVAPDAPGPADRAAWPAAVAAVGAVLRPGALVIVESAAPVAALRRDCGAALESAGRRPGELALAFCRGGIRADARVYRIADPVRRVVGVSPVAGALARAFLAPCSESRAEPPAPAGPVAPPAPRERIIGGLAAAQVLLLPWMFGGQSLAAQWLAAALALAALAALFLPHGSERAGERAAAAWRRLRGCAPFWAGLALAAQFACQWANPRLSVEWDAGAWKLVAREHAAWWPAGVEAPFALAGPPGGMNAARTLLIFVAPWWLFTALVCGVTSRRVTLVVWGAVVASVTAVAGFALVTRVSGVTWLFGRSVAGVGSPFGPFLYQNQGGAFLYLGFFATAGLVLRLHLRSAAPVSGSGPQGLLLACAGLVGAGALLSHSFAAAAVLAAGLPLLVFAATRLRRPVATPGLAAVVFLLAVLAAAVAWHVDFGGVAQKVRAKWALAQGDALDDRVALRAATRLMYADADALFGAGAGAFRWLAPVYFQKVPALCRPDGGVNLAQYAHCDWLQMLAEWGVWGVSAVAAGGAWWVARLRPGLRAAPAAWPPVFGLAMLAAHAGWDYLLFNPALLALVAVVAFLALAAARRRAPDGGA